MWLPLMDIQDKHNDSSYEVLLKDVILKIERTSYYLVLDFNVVTFSIGHIHKIKHEHTIQNVYSIGHSERK